ncbi:MAG: ABC transporter substrate-binding protein [Rhodobacterales bacterium]|jgi:4,5-dihydroxyphthalate decarboxylase|tara:strand:- start:528 stop:1520 length:993 start_codon:yes stop_codon:yes gene_type:complete
MTMPLSIAVGNYDRTRPLVDGRVQIDGVKPLFMTLTPEEMFFRAFRHADFDVTELSLASYAVSVAKEQNHYIALPIFLSRAFRHSSIYVTQLSNIKSPKDLKGKHIGIAEYQLTANVWVRALLEDEFGVKPSEIIWVRGGMDRPVRPEKLPLELPNDIKIQAAGNENTLNQMLLDGEIDGFIGPRAPKCFFEPGSKIKRLFDNSIDVGLEYFERTKIFPIMHVLGIRKRLWEEHPFLSQALCKAFITAKDIAEGELADTSATKVTMPFVEDHLDAIKEIMGNNFWSYGLDFFNRNALEVFLKHHYNQGLSKRELKVNDLFAPNSIETYSF